MNFRSDYKAYLSAAWRDHLQAKKKNSPTVISTFAGGGGSSLGYSMAGFHELLAVEWDDHAAETFGTNFPDVRLFHGDIANLTVRQCLSLSGLTPGELDVFDGSPPCQGFSTSGKRKLDDDRNQLFREYVRLLKGLKPKVFVMENVSGMVKGKMKVLFAEILRDLKAAGYLVSARLMNAKYFNVPQSRPRMIFIGIRKDLGIEPSHPGAENSIITCETAVIGVENKTFPIFRNNPNAQKMQSMLSKVPRGKNLQYCLKANAGFNMYKAHPHRPCNTILKSVSLSGRSSGIIHWSEDRLLTIEELKRFGSFPDEFQLSGRFEKQWERIGNSVPPLFMRSIAAHIRKHILKT